MSVKTCENCGKACKGKAKRFCSRECLYANGHTLCVCRVCGKQFKTQKSTPRDYCSRNCAASAQFSKPETRACKQCEHCGKEFVYWPKVTPVRRFCSRDCQRAGRRTLTTCPTCNNEFWYHNSWPRIYCSRECSATANYQRQLGEYSLTGADNLNWTGGKNQYGANWKEQRNKARERDKHKCKNCGISEKKLGQELHVHHIKPFKKFDGDYLKANKLSNLISLCPSCHPKAEHALIPIQPFLL